MNRKRLIILLLTLVLPLVLLLARPLGMSLRQSAVLAALILVVLWWVTGVVERTVASLLLLAVFLLVAQAPARTVFSFPLSANFLMIAFAFLFSQGISNSGLADKLISPLLTRWCGTPLRLIFAMILSSLLMLFVIPQPFSRIIILYGIFSGYFARAELAPELRAILFIGLTTFTTLVNSALMRGDIILNASLPTLGGVAIGADTWVRYMAVPTLVYLGLAVLLFCLVFRKPLRAYKPPAAELARQPLTRREIGRLVLIVAIVLMWALEGVHGVSGTVIVIVGTALFFPAGLLRLPDLKSVNVKLLVFLTAAFSIGGSLKACGVAELVFSLFTPLFPATFSLGYAAVALLSTMALHLLLGSNVTALSVVVPGLMSISAGVAPPLALLFLVFMGICGHFILPFHNTSFLLGEGSNYFTTRQMLRYTLPLTVLAIPCILLLYMGWWHLSGLL